MAKAKEVTVALSDTVSASFQMTPIEGAPEGLDVLGGEILKGKFTKEGMERGGFQAFIDGAGGEIALKFDVAINKAIAARGFNPAHYEGPTKWSDVKPSNEKAPEPTSLDDLSPDDAKAFKAAYSKLDKALADVAKKEGAARESAFKLAGEVWEVRSGFDKAGWSQFKKISASAGVPLVADFLGKNAVGEAYKSHAVRALPGFDVDGMLPEGVTGNKGVVTAYMGVINALATNAVRVIRSDKARDALGIDADGDNAALRAVLEYMDAEGVYSVTEAGTQVELDGHQARLASVVLSAHLANLPPEPAVFITSDKGKWSAVNCKALTGTEGPDELAGALARAMGSVEVAAASAAVTDAASALTKAAKEAKAPFADWDADTAARHLTNILFAGWNDAEDREAAADRIDLILAKMHAWADAIIEQNADVGDILNPEVATPDSVEDGEDAADAAMAG